MAREDDPKIAWLRTIPGIDRLAAKELRVLASTADRTTASAGTTLVREGRWGSECFVIADGEVEVRHGDELVARLGPGSVVGELAILDRIPRTADVVAVTDVEVAVFDVRTFQRVLDDDAGFRALVEQQAAAHRG